MGVEPPYDIGRVARRETKERRENDRGEEARFLRKQHGWLVAGIRHGRLRGEVLCAAVWLLSLSFSCVWWFPCRSFVMAR